MRKFDQRYLWGLLLITAGVVFLLQNLGIIEVGEAIVGVLFAFGGLAFLAPFLSDPHENWWAIIPGLVLLGIAGLILGDRLAPALMNQFGGPFFLGMIALAFWIVFAVHREFWWAIIPAGTLTTVAVIAGLADADLGIEVGGILFMGLALTFGALTLVDTPQGRMRWPLIPAAILLVFGILVLLMASQYIGYLWGAGLILVGIYLLFFMGRKPTKGAQ